MLIDEKPVASDALRMAVTLAERLGSELSVLTVRAGTHATEPTPPLGIDLPLDRRHSLPSGIQTLLRAADRLVAFGLLLPLDRIRLRDMPHGHLFAAPRVNGARVLFSERFGNLVEEVNREVDGNRHQLVIVSDPRRGPLGRFAPLNLSRRLALDLHCSFLVVRGGGVDNRLLVCADGSPAARRVFPLLRDLLPALNGPVDLICVRRPEAGPQAQQNAVHCLQQASAWLGRCGKMVRILEPSGSRRFKPIMKAAGHDALIVMGESHRHDIRRRTVGSLPMKVLARTESSFLLVKQATEPDAEMFANRFDCEGDTKNINADKPTHGG